MYSCLALCFLAGTINLESIGAGADYALNYHGLYCVLR